MKKLIFSFGTLFMGIIAVCQNPLLLKDIFPGNNAGTIQQIVRTTNYTFFNEDDDDADTDRSLFRTDGTNAGTIKLNLTYPGYISTKAEKLTALGNKVVFAGDNFTNYGEIWASDGTQAGTVAIERFQPNSNRIPVVEISAMGSYAYYSVINKDAGNVNHAYLRRTDGTAAGTSLVYDFSAFTGVPQVVFLTPVNNILYFIVYDAGGTGVDQLWRSDGTAAGTYMVYNFTTSAFVESFIMPAGNTFYIMIGTIVGGVRQNTIWKSDGTAAGTVPVKLIGTGNTNTYPPFAAIGSTLYFAGVDGNGKELWKTDGTAAGTVMAADINSGGGNSVPSFLTAFNNNLYFAAENPTYGGELWKYDGSVATLIKDINPGNAASIPQGFVASGNSLIFSAVNNTTGRELWITDGTSSNTVMIADINPGAASGSPNTFTPGNTVYFAASNGVNGFEVFKYDNNGDAIAGPRKFYVNDNSLSGDLLTYAIGNNSNNGSKTYPFATITYALSQVQAGDTIYVDAGTYAEQVTINKGITIIGAGQNLTSITNPGSPLVPPPGPFAENALIQTTQNIGDVNISNLQTTNVPANEGHSILLQTGGSVKNCRIIDGGLGVFIRVESAVKTVVVENNFIQSSVFAVACQGSGLTASVLNNTLNVTNPFFSVGIWVGLDFGPIVKLTATGNSINNYVYRGIVGNSYNTVLSENSILGTGQYAIENTASLAVATCNWYGVTDQYAVAAKISGAVNFSPWLMNGTDNDAAIGFQPVPGSCAGRQVFCVNDNSLTGDIYTSAVGNNANNGSFSAPLATIAAALAKVQPGDFILVDAGSYTEIVNITKNITMLGAGKGVTILNGPAGPVTPFPNTGETGIIQTVNGLTDVIIESLTVDGTASEEQHGIFIQGGGRVSNCELRYVNDGFYFQYISAQPRTAIGNNNYVHHINYVGSLFAGNGLSATAINNVIDLTGAQYGIGFIAGYGGNGNVASFTASNNSIINVNGFGMMIGSLQSAQVHNNSITRIGTNYLYIQNVHTVDVNASCNWYGTTAEAVISPYMSGAITYSPWLTNGADNDIAIGFQPMGNVCNGYPRKLYVNNNNLTGDVFTTAIGNDANSGTPTAPFATLNYALSVSKAGDSIFVDAGTYATPNITIDKAITILGSNYLINPNDATEALLPNASRNAEAIITGSTFTIGADNINVEGLTLDPGNKSAILMSGTSFSNLKFSRNKGILNAGNFISLTGVAVASPAIPAATGFNFTYNRFEKLSTGSGVTFNVTNLDYSNIDNNSFVVTGPTPRTQVTGLFGVVNDLRFTNNLVDRANYNLFTIQVTKLNVSANKVYNANNGLFIQSSVPVASDILVENNLIENNIPGLAIANILPCRVFDNVNASLSRIQIINNTINVNISGLSFVPTAINTQMPTTAANPIVIVSGNKVTYTGTNNLATGVSGMFLAGKNANTTIYANELTFSGTGMPVNFLGNGINTVTDGVNFPSNGIMNFLNNKISGFKQSIIFFDGVSALGDAYTGYGNLPTGVSININNNSFTADSLSINNGTVGASVSATCNWYGSSAEQDVKNKVTSTVQYIPWLTDGTDNDVATGFQPLANVCNGYPRKLYVNDNSQTGDVYTLAIGNNANPGTQAAPFSTLAFALSVAKAGDSIYVDAGTYVTPNLNINKSITILGANYNASPNNPADRLAINPVRNAEAMITGSTFTIASNDVRLEGLSFNPGALKSQVTLASTGVNNFTFKRNYSKITSGQLIVLMGTATSAGQTPAFGNYLIEDNRFESQATALGSSYIGVGNINGITVHNNTFLVPAALPQRLVSNSIASGIIVNYIYSNNISYASRNEWFSSSNDIRTLSIENNISLHGQRSIIIQAFSTVSSDMQIRNNYIENDFAELPPIQYTRSGTTAAGVLANLLIENNTIIQNATGRTSVPAAILAQNFTVGSVPSITIRKNKISFNGDYSSFTSSSVLGISYTGNWQNINLQENEIAFNGTNLTNTIPASGQSSSGISISSDNGTSTIPANGVVNIIGNKVSGFRNSIAVFDGTSVGSNAFVGYGNLPAGVIVNINNNSFTGDLVSINNGSIGQSINATCNWYGTASAQGVLAKVTPSTVVYSPWLTSGIDSDIPATGFQPVAASCSGTPVIVVLNAATNITCFNAGNGSISITLSGGTAPFTIAWSKDGDPYSSNEDLINLTPGTFDLLITDANGSVASLSDIVISEPLLLEAVATGTNVSCFNGSNGSASVTAEGGTAPYTYLWSNGGTTEDITNLTAGTYSVIITDVNGCTSNASYEVTQPALLTAIATGSSTTCFNSILLAVSGGTAPYTYLWSNGATTSSISSVAAGTYSVTVTDAKGCVATAGATVTASEAFNPSAQVTDVSCNGGTNGTITVTNVNAVAPFQYSINGGVSFQGSNIFNGLAAGTYTITVKDANGCTGFVTKTISQPTLLTATLVNVQSTCFGLSTGSISVNVAGGTTAYSYAWTGPAGYSSSQKNISNLPAGTYNFTVTDSKGCIATLSATVLSSNQITIGSTVTNIACKGETNGSIVLNVTGGSGNGFTYLWSNGAVTSSISNLGVANYTVTVTDIGSGCTKSQTFAITQPANSVNLSTTKTNATGCASLGTITATGSGGTSPYQYKLDNGAYQASGLFPGLYTGNYTVWVKDANGCTKSVVVSITDNGSDEYEGNNSKNQAKTINTGTDIYARIALASDAADWFKFTTTASGTYTLTFIHSSASFVFNLYAGGNNTPALVPTGSTATTKQYSLLANTTYYIGITGGLSYVCYRLNVSAPSFLTRTSSPGQPVKETIADLFEVKVLGNPSANHFNIVVNSSSNEKMKMRVVDVSGRIIEQKENLSAGEVIRIGERYRSGVYFAEIRQGNNSKTIKLVKL